MAKKAQATKASVKARTAVQSHAVAASITEKKVTPKSFKFKKLYVLFALGIIALGALLYMGRGLFVAAVVNGQPISRLAIVKETEKQSGKQALQTIVRNTLIEQEARKSSIVVSEQDVTNEIKKIEESLSKQGQKLDDALATNGMTRKDLQAAIKTQKQVEKIVGKDIKVTDEEISKYLEKNKEFLPKDQSEEVLRKSATEQIKQEKLNTKINEWLQALQTKAKIMYFVQY